MNIPTTPFRNHERRAVATARLSKPLLTLMALLLHAGLMQGADELSLRLQKGLFEEEANQNLDAAIAAYQSVVVGHDEGRKLTATALFRLGECYRKLGRTNEAVVRYQRLLQDFSEQTNLAASCEQSLRTLGLGVISRAAEQGGVRKDPVSEGAPGSFQQDPESLRIRYLEELLKESPDLVNASGPNSRTHFLHDAVLNGQVQVARFLLTHGAEVDTMDPTQRTPLHLAAEKGNRAMVELLLSHRASVNLWDSSRRTPLMIAAGQGFKSVTDLLLQRGADVNLANNRGVTALHTAVANNLKEIVEVLLEHKADVNAESRDGTPLMLAVSGGWVNMARLLLDRGARVDARLTSGHGGTALVTALGGDIQQPMLELLLDRHADPNVRYRVTGMPIYRSEDSFHQSPKIDAADFTPLMGAAIAGNPAIVRLLLAHGAKPEFRDEHGATALIWAVRRTQVEIAELLLKGGADIDAVTKVNQTALMIASTMGHVPMVELLLQHGAKVNLAGASTRPALHGAVYRRHKRVIELLLEHGADLTATDPDGVTALDIAKDGLRAGLNVATGVLPASMSAEAVLETLRHAGASEFVPRHGIITVCRAARSYSAPIFFEGTNSFNHHTLLEFLDQTYATPAGALPFPDLTRIRINRRDPTTRAMVETTINVDAILRSGDCGQDRKLEWGDVVEIPEQDHPTVANWGGFETEVTEFITRCLTCEVSLIVKGETNRVRLLPPAVPTLPRPAPRLPRGAAPLLSIPPGASPPPAATAPGRVPELHAELHVFRLREVLYSANVLRVSSDVTRVKVRRSDATTGEVKEMIFNCASRGSALEARSDLRLRDGDVIEIPDK